MDDALGAWGRDSRGFWTRRRRTALSLAAVLGLVAGAALAFKLFDRVVPNNVSRNASVFDFEIWKRDAALGETDFTQTGAGTAIFEATGAPPSPGPNPLGLFPGDVRTVEVKLVNTNDPPQDATFFVFVDAIQVQDQSGNPIPTTDPRRSRFVELWSFEIDKQLIVSPGGNDVASVDDHGLTRGNLNSDPDDNLRPEAAYAKACDDEIRAFTRQNACNIGNVRRRGTRDALAGRLDQRYYLFKIKERDDPSDQSAFQGWRLTFTLIFQARLPALAEMTIPQVAR